MQYSLPDSARQAIKDMPLVGYPARGGAAEAALEDQIQSSLPIIPGITAGMSQDERIEAMSRHMADQHREFVAMHGSAFPCDLVMPSPVALVELAGAKKQAVAQLPAARADSVRQVA